MNSKNCRGKKYSWNKMERKYIPMAVRIHGWKWLVVNLVLSEDYEENGYPRQSHGSQPAEVEFAESFEELFNFFCLDFPAKILTWRHVKLKLLSLFRLW